MAGNPTGAMGVPDYLGWGWKSKAGIPIVCVPGLPGPPRQHVRDDHLPAVPGDRPGADDPARRGAAADVAVRRDGARGLRPCRLLRAGRLRHRVRLAEVHRQARLLGPGREVQRAQARLDQRRRRLPERRRHLHRLHDARLPRQVHAVHGRAARVRGCRRWPAALYGTLVRSLRKITAKTVDEEPKWRVKGSKLLTGYKGEVEVGPWQPRPKRSGRRRRTSSSSRWRGTRSRASSAASGSTPRSTGPTRPSSECHSTSSIFRGYSIFMKGKDPRDAHFITSRICGICGDNHATCSCYAQNMAYGVHPPALGEQIVNLGEAAEYMFDHNIFQENLVGVDFCEKMVAETNPGVLELANRTEAPHAGRPRLQDHRRHHALAEPVHRRVLPRGAAGQPLHPRDVLPDGGAPRPPVDAVPRRRRHGRDDPAVHRLRQPAHALRRVHEARRAAARRPVRLLLRGDARLRGGRQPAHPARLLGCVPGSRRLQLPVQGHDQVGPGDGRHARRRRRRQARHQRPRRHQPRHPHPARQLVLPELGGPGDVRHQGPARATRSTATTRGTRRRSRGRRSATSTPTTAGSCRHAGSTARTTSPSTPAAARSPACGRRRCRVWSTSAAT